jgi:hypothetical protein
MTSHLSIATQLDPMADVANADHCGADAELNLELTRRYDDGYEQGASNAAAALFAGLFIGAGSTAMMIGLAALFL